MKRTYKVISKGEKKGWIVGHGDCRNGHLGDPETVFMSLDLDEQFPGVDPKTILVNEDGTLEENAKAINFYIEKQIQKLAHRDFYNTYLAKLSDDHAFPDEKARYEKARADIQKMKEDLEKKKRPDVVKEREANATPR